MYTRSGKHVKGSVNMLTPTCPRSSVCITPKRTANCPRVQMPCPDICPCKQCPQQDHSSNITGISHSSDISKANLLSGGQLFLNSDIMTQTLLSPGFTIFKNTRAGLGCTSLVGCWPSRQEALCLTPVPHELAWWQTPGDFFPPKHLLVYVLVEDV